MKARYIIASVLAVVALGTLVACGGGDDDGELSGIRTQKGLSVAAITEGLTGATEESDLAGGAGTTSDRQTGAPQLANTGLDAGVSSDSMRFGGAPLLQQGTNGITVQGYGSAMANADAAIIEFYFSSNGTGIEPSSGRAEDSGGGVAEPALAPDAQEVQQITEADLQPVIDAITGAGISREDIQFVGQSYFDKYYSSATIRVSVNNVDAV
ncbi:MAG TPA: hypothetical protein VGR43_04775, partial [Dehalococcoidia bacterium]|nr:hypothetical protein [Dehalococcoidia bacterium]